MTRILSSFTSTVGNAWCQLMHPEPMWPVNGVYQCRECHRKFPVAWEKAAPAASPEPPSPRPRAEAIHATITQ